MAPTQSRRENNSHTDGEQWHKNFIEIPPSLRFEYPTLHDTVKGSLSPGLYQPKMTFLIAVPPCSPVTRVAGPGYGFDLVVLSIGSGLVSPSPMFEC